MVHEWAQLMQSLAAQSDGLREVRFTAIAAAGGIAPLLGLLHHGVVAPNTLQTALDAVALLATNSHCCDRIRQAGGVPLLVRLLAKPSTNSQVKEYAVRALGHLASSSDANRKAVQDGGNPSAREGACQGPSLKDRQRCRRRSVQHAYR